MTDEPVQEVEPQSPQQRSFRLTISGRIYQVLWTLKERLGAPMDDVLREAIVLMWKVDSELRAGSKVLIRRPEGSETELTLPGLGQRAGHGRARASGGWITPEAWCLIRWLSAATLVGCMWGMLITTIITAWWAWPATAAILVATIFFAFAGPPPIVSRWITRLRQKA